MSAKHTPGPWIAEDKDRHGQPQIEAIHGGLIAIVCHECVMPNDELNANARLIAAAPCLYEALNAFLENGMNRETIDAAKAAIAKATGK